MSEPEMGAPSRQLDRDAARLTVPQLLRGLPGSLRPMVTAAREHAPRAAPLVLAPQALSGTAFAFGPLATTGVPPVLPQGRGVEQGTHDDPVTLGGRYAGMYRPQADLHAEPVR
ncbi:hypothetical protein [Saccharothrix lopnurensis]|uniref:Uncharacterized protein n=1 Tax=Saccharothrix lopnurensis TaxID=1670621 RepID=A0ABW1PAM7_9PSEU